MNDACSECGSTTWTASVVDEKGARTCADCFVGVTPMLARGVPIARLSERPAPEDIKR